LAGERGGHYYSGDLNPENIGDILWDPQEKEFVLRVAGADEPFPCGWDCCGTEVYAVVAISPE